METCDQNAVDGFSFSQDLTSGLSQMYSQMSQMTTQSMDSGFYGDSQSLKDSQSLSQSFGGVRSIQFAFWLPSNFARTLCHSNTQDIFHSNSGIAVLQ